MTGKPLVDHSAWHAVFAPLCGLSVGLVRMPGNAGDLLIEAGLEALLSAYGVRWRWGFGPDDDVLLVCGGGNMGRRWEDPRAERRLALAAGAPVWVLPQTWWGHDPEADAGAYRRLWAREPTSLAFAPQGCGLAPDLALALPVQDRGPPALAGGVFLRGDRERLVAGPSGTDPAAACRTHEDYLGLAAGHAEVVTDRLHFAVAALLCGRKATLLPGGYHKNRSVWEYSLKGLGCAWADSAPEVGS